MSKIYCDQCKYEFMPALQEVDGHQYFSCPNCAKKYMVGYITPKGIELRARLSQSREALQNYHGKEYKKQLRVVKKLLKEYQREYIKAGADDEGSAMPVL